MYINMPRIILISSANNRYLEYLSTLQGWFLNTLKAEDLEQIHVGHTKKSSTGGKEESKMRTEGCQLLR